MNNQTKQAAQITELTARRETLREEIARMPEGKSGTPWHTDRVDELHALTRKIQAAEDERIKAERFNESAETIIYQDREIEARKVNYISGNIPTSTWDVEGDEELFRDAQGCYYLRRELHWLDGEDARRRASGRALIHRVSVKAAILWTATRLNSETLDLRSDAAGLLADTPPMMRNAALLRCRVDKDTLAAAERYGAKYGRTLEQLVVESLECFAQDGVNVAAACERRQGEEVA